MKIQEIFESQVPTYTGNIFVPKDWKDLSGLAEKYPGYTPRCKLIGNFDCIDCASLTSLDGAPIEVSGYFDCMRCFSLTTLEGAPATVGGIFYCAECTALTTLEGAPAKVIGNFSCSDCTSLTSLKGAPTKVGGNFYCNRCTSLTSLEGIPIEISDMFICSGCISLKRLLGLLRIKIGSKFKGSKFTAFLPADLAKAIEIINKYDGLKDIIPCKVELIEAGLKEFAKL